MKITKEMVEEAGYEVLADGTIIGKRGRPLTPSLCSDGHHQVQLTIDGHGQKHHVHSLVALFHLPPAEENQTDIDHKDRNKINNDVSNLRRATAAQNRANMASRANSSSKYKGVTWTRGRWGAKIIVGGRTKWLGYYDDEADAGRAYDQAAIEHYGKFALLNFPEDQKDSDTEHIQKGEPWED